MVPLRLFRSRAFAAGNAVTFCLFATLLALVFFMAQFLQTGLGYGPAMGACAGLALLGAAAGLAIPKRIAPVAPYQATPPGRSHHGPHNAPGSSRTPEFSRIHDREPGN
jgi:hypothetical protein